MVKDQVLLDPWPSFLYIYPSILVLVLPATVTTVPIYVTSASCYITLYNSWVHPSDLDKSSMSADTQCNGTGTFYYHNITFDW